MSRVNNLNPMERIIHQAFHDIADKYEIDVNLIAQIIGEYDNIMSKQIKATPIVHEN